MQMRTNVMQLQAAFLIIVLLSLSLTCFFFLIYIQTGSWLLFVELNQMGN